MPNWNLNPRFFNANEKVRIRPTAEGLVVFTTDRPHVFVAR